MSDIKIITIVVLIIIVDIVAAFIYFKTILKKAATDKEALPQTKNVDMSNEQNTNAISKKKIEKFDYEEMDMEARVYRARAVLDEDRYIVRFYCDHYYNKDIEKIGNANCLLSLEQSNQLTRILDKVTSIKREINRELICDGFIGSLIVNYEGGLKKKYFIEEIAEVYSFLEENVNSYTITDKKYDYLENTKDGRFEDVDWSHFLPDEEL